MILSTRLLPQAQSVRRVAVVAGATKEKEENKESKVVGKGVLAKRLAEEHSGMSVKQAGEFIDALLDEIMLSVAEGQDVTIPGFGSFKKRTRAARTGRNPSTGEALQIPETDAPSFSAGTVFKGVVKTGSWEAYDEMVIKQKEEAKNKRKK
jgi:DNA-binding protein HU-beta